MERTDDEDEEEEDDDERDEAAEEDDVDEDEEGNSEEGETFDGRLDNVWFASNKVRSPVLEDLIVRERKASSAVRAAPERICVSLP